jgi:hypothetical protein
MKVQMVDQHNYKRHIRRLIHGSAEATDIPTDSGTAKGTRETFPSRTALEELEFRQATSLSRIDRQTKCIAQSLIQMRKGIEAS